MLLISKVAKDENTPVTDVKFSTEWSPNTSPSDSPMVACFRKGERAELVFREEPMSDEPKEEKKDETDQVNLEEGESEGGMDVGTIIKMIESGEISVADFEAIRAAMAVLEGPAEPEMNPEEQVAPAAVPGGESFQADPPEVTQMTQSNGAPDAVLQGRVDALEASLAAQNAANTRRDEVDSAVDRLQNRPMGSDLKAKLTAFHEAHGSAAFSAYVDSLESTFAEVHGAEGAAEGDVAAVQGGKASDAVLMYQKDGPEAVEQAVQFSAEWRELYESGYTQMDEKSYLAISFARHSRAS
jgi:hypothetical protein